MTVHEIINTITFGEPAKSGGKYVYSGSFVTSLLTGETADNATQITFRASAISAEVVFKGIPETVKVNGFERDVTDNYDGTATLYVNVGDTVIIEVASGQSLYDKGKNKLSLDQYNKYKFRVETDKDGEYAFTVKDDSAVANEKYELYQITEKDGTVTEVTGPIAANYVDAKSFTFAIKKQGESDYLPIEEAKVAEGLKSTVKITDDEESGTEKALAVVSVAKEDAGKTVSVELKYRQKDIADGTVEIVTAATAVLNVEAVPSVSISGVKKSGDTVKIDAGTTAEYALVGKAEDLANVVVVKNSKNKVTAELADGIADDGTRKLSITAPAEEVKGEEIQLAYGKDNKNIVYTLKVDSVLPALKLSKFDSPAQGSNDVTVVLEKDKNVKTASKEGSLFYEVKVDATGSVQPAGSLSGKAFYFPVAEGEDSVSAKLKVNTAKAADAAGKYKLTARIVLVKGGVTGSKASKDPVTGIENYYTSAATPVADSNIVKAGKAVTKTVSTRNDYYEDKLGVTKKSTTVYTGQTAVIAVAKYSKKASHISDLKAEVYETNGVPVSEYDINTYCDETTGEIGVIVADTSYIANKKYDVLVRAEGVTDSKSGTETMYRATAKVTITVAPGISDITSPGNKIKVYVNPKKGANYTFKPAAESLGYKKGNTYSTTPKTSKFTYDLTEISSELAPYVTLKKNKLTVKNSVKLGNDPDDNTFTVTVKADDYNGNYGGNRKKEVQVELTSSPVQVAEVYLAENGNENKPLPATIDLNQAYNAEVVAKDSDGNIITDFVSIKASNAKWQTKPAKNVTFTATANDGGKSKKPSGKYTVTYAASSDLNVVFDQADGEDYNYENTLVKTGENTYEYIGTIGGSFNFGIEDDGQTVIDYSRYGLKFKVDNGKFISYSNGQPYAVTPGIKKAVTTMTVTTGDKKTIKITLTNKNFQTTAAPSARLVEGKLYSSLNKAQTLKYKVTGKNIDAFDAVYVAYDSGYKAIETGIYPISPDDTFALDSHSDNLSVGTGKYSIIYGTAEKVTDGEGNIIYYNSFEPATKAGTLTVKVNKLAKYKPQASYTLNLDNSKYIYLTGKPDNTDVYFTDLRNANVKGQPNTFTKYFKIVPLVEKGEEFKAIEATDALIKDIKADKVDAAALTGYVQANVFVGNGISEQDVKITVKIDTKVPQYKASKVTLLGVKGASAETQIMLGKSGVILKSAEAADKTNWKAEAVVEKKYDADGKEVKVLTNCITLKANTAVAPGKQTVQVKIVPDGSESKGITVDIPVTVGDVDKTKGKVKISNVNIDLGKANTDGSFVTTGYDAKKKCGVWTVTLPEGTGYSYTVDGIELKAAALGSDKFDYIEAKLDSKKNIVLTVYNTGSVKLGKTVKNVPVDLTFDAGSVSDPVKVNVIVPKSVPDMAGIAADITSYINGKCNQATDAAAINAELGKDKYKKAAEFANVTIGTAAVNTKDADDKETEDKKNWVHITLTDKADSKNTQKIDIELPEASTDGAQTIDQAYEALAKKAKLIVVKKPEANQIPEGMSESDYLVPSNETTAADIRAFLGGVVTNEDVMFSVLGFDIVTEAVIGEPGELTFSYRLIGKRGVEEGDGSHFNGNQRVTVSVVIPAKPEETAAGN